MNKPIDYPLLITLLKKFLFDFGNLEKKNL